MAVGNSLSDVATLSMKRGPVNNLSMEMLTDLIIAMDKLESNKSLQGLVLTSVCKESVWCYAFYLLHKWIDNHDSRLIQLIWAIIQQYITYMYIQWCCGGGGICCPPLHLKINVIFNTILQKLISFRVNSP